MIKTTMHDRNNNYLDIVSERIEPMFLEELSDTGMGSFKLHVDADDLDRTPTLLDYDNIVHMHDEKSGKTFLWKIEAKKKVVLDSSERTGMVWEVSGRGVMALLEEGVVYPEYSLRRESDDNRAFTFASKQSQWYVASEWSSSALQYVARKDDVSYRKGFPKNWPDKNAKWMWYGDPKSNQPDGRIGYFRLPFTTASANGFRIFITADDRFWLWVDGDMVLKGKNYKRVYRTTIDLPAGDHVIAVKVRNRSDNGSARKNMCGLLFSMFHLNNDGDRTSVAYRTAGGNGWKGRDPSIADPPGWDAGDIMKQLMNEAQARNARGPLLISEGWTGTNDSEGNAWGIKHDRSISIGTDLLSVLLQICETHVDCRMDGMTLNMFNQDYGSDLTTGSNPVTLRPAVDLQEVQHEGDHSGVKTHLLIRTADGWTQKDSGNIGPKGRREGLFTASNAHSDKAAERLAMRVFKTRSDVVDATTLKTRATSASKPWADYDLGDWVFVPISGLRDFERRRVWGIGATEDASGNVLYAVEVASS